MKRATNVSIYIHTHMHVCVYIYISIFISACLNFFVGEPFIFKHFQSDVTSCSSAKTSYSLVVVVAAVVVVCVVAYY